MGTIVTQAARAGPHKPVFNAAPPGMATVAAIREIDHSTFGDILVTSVVVGYVARSRSKRAAKLHSRPADPN